MKAESPIEDTLIREPAPEPRGLPVDPRRATLGEGLRDTLGLGA